MADQDFIPDDQFVPDPEPQQPQAPQQSAPDFIPDEHFKEDKPQTQSSASPDFVPDDEFKEDQEPGFLDRLSANIKGPKAGESFSKEELQQMISPTNPENMNLAQTGLGNANAIMPGLQLASFGARGLKGAIESGLYQGKDEIDKAALGQGDPSSAVAARIAGSMIPGFLIGGVTGQAPKGANAELKALEDSKLGSHLSDMLTGIGHSLSPNEQIPEEIKSKIMFKVGNKISDALGSNIAAPIVGGALGLLGHPETGLLATGMEAGMKYLFGKPLAKKMGPWFIKAASSGAVKNPIQIFEHAKAINKGDSAMNKAVEGLFAKGGQKVYDGIVSDDDKDKIKNYVDTTSPLEQESQQQGQGFADGGEVMPSPNNEIANHWPEQNTLLNASRARVHGYLNSVKPNPNPTKLPFDSDHKDPQKERDYEKAVHLAASPLSILNHVKKGTLVPKQMVAFNSMYPEIHQELSKRITKQMMQHQLEGNKRPPYHVRQAMSLFLGSNLDSTLTPQGIMSAQAVFAKQSAMKNPPPNSKSSLSKMGSNAQTASQARDKALNKT